jgi:hypothetical protein
MRQCSAIDHGGRRGRLSLSPLYLVHNVRAQAVALINEATATGARSYGACEVLKISTRTFRRWESGTTDRLRGASHKRRSNCLSEEERNEIKNVCVPRISSPPLPLPR